MCFICFNWDLSTYRTVPLLYIMPTANAEASIERAFQAIKSNFVFVRNGLPCKVYLVTVFVVFYFISTPFFRETTLGRVSSDRHFFPPCLVAFTWTAPYFGPVYNHLFLLTCDEAWIELNFEWGCLTPCPCLKPVRVLVKPVINGISIFEMLLLH